MIEPTERSILQSHSPKSGGWRGRNAKKSEPGTKIMIEPLNEVASFTTLMALFGVFGLGC
jgi:hypothetical protein